MGIVSNFSVQSSMILTATKRRKLYHAEVDEGRKRVLAIVAGILVARHLKTTDDLLDSRSHPLERNPW